MHSKLLYATTNPGKIFEVGKLLESHNINIVSPKDLKLDLDVEETGSSLKENAHLKAKAFLKAAPEYLVMADDTGVEIDALNGEPGIHVRRWKDKKTRMTDQEIIDYCIDQMKGIPKQKRTAKFHTVVALAHNNKIETFDGFLNGTIVKGPAPLKYKGFPFEAMFFIPEWRKLLGDVHNLSIEEKIAQKYYTHRERAVLKAIPRIKEIIK